MMNYYTLFVVVCVLSLHKNVDAQSATGTAILGLSVAAKGTTSFTVPAMGRVCETNIFVDIAGSGASATVYWD